MISLCVVTVKKRSEKFMEKFMESLFQQTNIIDEILIVDTKENATYFSESVVNGITIKKRGIDQLKLIGVSNFDEYSFTHAEALHSIIHITKNEHVLVAHHDIFLYSNAPKILKDLMDNYNLDIIGCSVPNISYHCQGCFPNLIFTLIKKSSLPDKDFLKGKITLSGMKLDGYYFSICDKLEPDLMNLYPYPDGAIDTGHLLYLCSTTLNWRWLAFVADGIHDYNTKYFRSNIKNIKLKPQKLIYHQSGGTHFWPESETEFIKAYDKHKYESIENN